MPPQIVVMRSPGRPRSSMASSRDVSETASRWSQPRRISSLARYHALNRSDAAPNRGNAIARQAEKLHGIEPRRFRNGEQMVATAQDFELGEIPCLEQIGCRPKSW